MMCQVCHLLCSGSTYADNLVDQNVSLSAAVHGRQDVPVTEQNPYANLSDWLAQSDLVSYGYGFVVSALT